MTSNTLRHPVDSRLPSGLPSSLTNTPAPVSPAPAPRRWADSRLRSHADYQRVYAVARKQFSSSMAWFAALRTEPTASNTPARIGLTVGKVLGKAHERNRIKRRLRSAIRAHRDRLPDGLDLILHPRRTALSADFSALLGEVEAIFTQAADFALRHPHTLVKKPSAVPERSPRRSATKRPATSPASKPTKASGDKQESVSRNSVSREVTLAVNTAHRNGGIG